MPGATGPDLLSLFPPATAILAEAVLVPGADVPPPYRDLLVHEHHMTVAIEAYHRTSVDVDVLDRLHEGDAYSRKILLRLHGSGKVVQFGLVRIHFGYCSPEVRAAILAEKTPLGRILIEHDVLRRIHPIAFLRIAPGPDMLRWFGMQEPETIFGRIAVIFCDGQPAIEVLEIVRPERTTT